MILNQASLIRISGMGDAFFLAGCQGAGSPVYPTLQQSSIRVIYRYMFTSERRG